MFFWIFICFVEFISANSQIITQTIAQISQHSQLHSPTIFGNSLLSFKEIVRQKTSGNQLQQCPCVTLPGSNKCISYDSRFQAASLEEAILTFVDTSMDPRIFDDRLGQPIGGGTFLCGTEECRQCVALLVLRLREINLIRGPPDFSFRLPAINQIRPELCRRLRLGQSISIPPSPTPVPGYVAEMIRQGLTQRAAQTSSRPVSAFGAMVQRAIQLAREFKGRPFFDAVLKERQERLQNTRRIQNDGRRNENSGSGGGRSFSGGGRSGSRGQSGNAGSSGGSRGNSGGNTGGRGQGRSSSGISGEKRDSRGGSSGGGKSVGNGGRPSPGNNGNSGRNPSRQQSNQPGSRWPINQPGPVVRPLIQHARNFFQNRQNQIQVQTQQSQIIQQPVQQVVHQPFQQQSVQQRQFQQQFVQPQQQFVQPQQQFQRQFQQQFQQPFQQPALSSISSVAPQSQPWAWNAAPWSTTASQGTGQSSGGSGVGVGWGGGGGGGFGNNQRRTGGGVGIAGAIASLFGRKKRAISDRIIGDRFVISCVERGDAENDETNFINLCTACWTWRQLPSDYFPRLINELVCQENDFCLSGWGSCQQRYRNVDVLRRGANGWQPTTISVASCCDCKVKAGSEVHALVIGDNKR